jgi:hypothetical protein
MNTLPSAPMLPALQQAAFVATLMRTLSKLA